MTTEKPPEHHWGILWGSSKINSITVTVVSHIKLGPGNRCEEKFWVSFALITLPERGPPPPTHTHKHIHTHTHIHFYRESSDMESLYIYIYIYIMCVFLIVCPTRHYAVFFLDGVEEFFLHFPCGCVLTWHNLLGFSCACSNFSLGFTVSWNVTRFHRLVKCH